MTNKIVSIVLSLVGSLMFISNSALAEYPDKEVRIIVNYGTGGGVDRTARSMQRFLPEALGQQVLVENHGGAGGKIGYKYYLEQPKNLYNILCAFIPALTGVEVKNPGLVNLDELAFINVQWSDPALLVADKDAPFDTLEELIKEAKKNPGKYSFSMSGKGAVGYLLSKILFDELGLEINIVPYSGGGEARAAIQGGHVQLTAAGAGTMLSVKDTVKPLGIFWGKSIKTWPEVKPINGELKKYGVEVPDGAAYRFFAVTKEAKENDPEGFAKLVEAFRKTTQDNQEFIAFSEKTKVDRDWYGPEETTKILVKAHDQFLKILKEDN